VLSAEPLKLKSSLFSLAGSRLDFIHESDDIFYIIEPQVDPCAQSVRERRTTRKFRVVALIRCSIQAPASCPTWHLSAGVRQPVGRLWATSNILASITFTSFVKHTVGNKERNGTSVKLAE